MRNPLVPFSALAASYFAHIGFFNPYLPLWLKDLGLPLVTISALISLQSATRLFAPYFWGMLSDRTGERVRLLRWSAFAALVSSLGLWWSGGGVLWLSLVLLFMFTNTSVMMPMSEAAMAHLVSQGGSFDSRRYGRVRLWGSVGFLITVFATGVWFERFGLSHFPAWTLATLAAMVACTWMLPNVREDTHSATQAHVPVGPVLRQPVVRWFFASTFFHVQAHMVMYLFLSLLLDAHGYSKSTIGMLWALSVVVEVVWFFYQGRWLPRWPLTAWLVACALVMVVRMGITGAGVAWLGWMVLAQLLHALTFAAHHTACIGLISQHFPGRLRGRGQALYTILAYSIPGLIVGLGGGGVASRWGLEWVFYLAAISSALAALCAWQMARHERLGNAAAAAA